MKRIETALGIDARAAFPRSAAAAAFAVAALLVLPASAAAAPAAPSITGTDPVSPSSDNTPLVKGTSDASTDSISVFKDTCTGSPLATGTKAAFESTGIEVTVAADTSTSLVAAATDTGPDPDEASPCSAAVTYVEDSTAPAAPEVTSTDPVSPANNNDPKVKGTAPTGTTVKLYVASDCSGTAAVTGTAAQFSGAGIAVTVPDNSSTSFYATATDAAGNASACSSTSVEYVEDSAAAPPTLSGTSPGSPANDNEPEVFGAAEPGSTVALYTSTDCSGAPAATGPEASFSAGGLTVTVPDDSSTSFYGKVTDASGNVSTCSLSSVQYVEDSTAPGMATVDRTNPVSPANDNEPEVYGVADAGSIVKVYINSQCSGLPVAVGGDAEFASTGLTAHVADDSTVTFYATASDQAGNASACSSTSVSYVEDSTAPKTRVTFAPGGKTDDRTPTFLFTVAGDEDRTTYLCKLDRNKFKRCGSPKTYGKLSFRRHSFKVRAIDEAGNVDTSAAGRRFRVTRG